MENFSYILVDEETKQAAVVDPGFEHEKILNKAKEQNLKITKILLTHTHFDHITDLGKLMEKTKAKVYVHKDESLTVPHENIKDNDIITLGKIKIKVLHTPGHSAGGVCFLIDNKLFTGDTLFVNSIGRTDLPESDEKQMFQSLKKLSKLPDNIEVYPGHDYGNKKSSTICEEKKENPFMKFG
ncbi:MAG: MBL fold metallo-hydrolase [Nanoarchaeota archaeon]|nr:MBL fold metallo-hydrolase [Nanoarchaeota archaeon]